MEKQALACLMKKNTSGTGKWIAERTQMGHYSTESLAINPFAREKSRAPPVSVRSSMEALIEK
jgi:hypothetical protein